MVGQLVALPAVRTWCDVQGLSHRLDDPEGRFRVTLESEAVNCDNTICGADWLHRVLLVPPVCDSTPPPENLGETFETMPRDLWRSCSTAFGRSDRSVAGNFFWAFSKISFSGSNVHLCSNAHERIRRLNVGQSKNGVHWRISRIIRFGFYAYD